MINRLAYRGIFFIFYFAYSCVVKRQCHLIYGKTRQEYKMTSTQLHAYQKPFSLLYSFIRTTTTTTNNVSLLFSNWCCDVIFICCIVVWHSNYTIENPYSFINFDTRATFKMHVQNISTSIHPATYVKCIVNLTFTSINVYL